MDTPETPPAAGQPPAAPQTSKVGAHSGPRPPVVTHSSADAAPADAAPAGAPLTQRDEAPRSFPKRLRVRKRGHFMRIQREGARLATPCFLVHARSNGGAPVRLGITASKKVGKAHERNRAKRLTREAFRHSPLRAMEGFDLVLIIKQESPPTALAPLIAELAALGDEVARALAQRGGRGAPQGRGRGAPPRRRG